MTIANKIAFQSKADHPRMRAFTRSHFRSRNKDGGHAIRSTIAENPTLHANFTAPCVIEAKLLPMEFSHCAGSGVVVERSFTLWKYALSTFPAPVTLNRAPSYTNLTRTPQRYTGGANMNFLSQVFRKLSSDRHTQIQKGRHDRNYRPTTPLKTRFFGLHFRRKQYGSIFNHFDVIGPNAAVFGRITQNNGHYTVHGHKRHRFLYMCKAHATFY